MTDTKSCMYNLFELLNEMFEGRFYGRYTDMSKGEPNIWEGTNMHTFYDVYNSEGEELYVKGNIDLSNKSELDISVKLIPVQKRIDAESRIHSFRSERPPYCEVIEEIMMKRFRDFDLANLRTSYSFLGNQIAFYQLEDIFETILDRFPAIRGDFI